MTLPTNLVHFGVRSKHQFISLNLPTFLPQHMAYEYARLGARLSLVARRKEKLEEVAANSW